ncbi:hypothetical protein Hanom_Chr06g00496871 [Helianthus anomalus]
MIVLHYQHARLSRAQPLLYREYKVGHLHCSCTLITFYGTNMCLCVRYLHPVQCRCIPWPLSTSP